MKGKSELLQFSGENNLLEVLQNYKSALEFKDKYKAIRFEEYEAELRSLEYWLKLDRLFDTVKSESLIPSDTLKEIMQNNSELDFFNLSLEYLISSEHQKPII